MEDKGFLRIVVITLLIYMMTLNVRAAKELPKGFERCRKSDQNVNECLMNAIQESLSILKNGVPSLNIPPIEPMEISSVGIDHNQKSNAFNMQSTFKNAKIHGLTASNVKKTSAKFKNFSMKAEAFTKRLDFVGDYKMTGQILLFPISGEGFSNVSMNELITKHEIHGDYYEGKDNQTYIKITSYKIKFLPKWVTFIFDNLFNGDKLLGDTINNFMNSNWEPVFFGIIPDYEKSFGEKFKAVANTLFNQVPANHIFLN